MKQIVVKADKQEEDFNKDKLAASLLKAGASGELSVSAADEVGKQFKNCMNTDDIYNRTLDQIKKNDPMAALKYTLKRSIMSLGPDGFIFEKYAAKILEQNGYTTEMPPQILSGFCVNHEVDIIAGRKDENIMIECKFYNDSGKKSDIKTALYINSRFLDLKKGWENKNSSKSEVYNKEDNNKVSQEGNYEHNSGSNNKLAAVYEDNPENPYVNKLTNTYYFTGAWLFTNTKCSLDAIKYAKCSGMKITAWNYPENESLQFYIESKKLYPITILSTLSKNHKRKLFEKNILTIKELLALQIGDLIGFLSLDDNYAAKVLDEISLLSS